MFGRRFVRDTGQWRRIPALYRRAFSRRDIVRGYQRYRGTRLTVEPSEVGILLIESALFANGMPAN